MELADLCVMLVFIPFFFRFTEHVHPAVSDHVTIFKGELKVNDILCVCSFPYLVSFHCSVHLYICHVCVPFCEVLPCD